MAAIALRFSLFLVFFTSIKAGYVSFDELYEDGLEAYINDNWKSAIVFFERAIESYKLYKSGIGKCYRLCKDVKSENVLISQTALGRIVTKAACNRECLDKVFGDSRRITRISSESKKLFEELKPYPYLQFAYFKVGNLRKSVAVTHTYHLRYPDDKLMKANMDFFNTNEDVTDDMFVDLEVRPHLQKYNQAVEFYAKEDYSTAVTLFEEALTEYYEEEETCRAVCEGEDENRETPDNNDINFFRVNAEHYIQVLDCSLKCVRDLGLNERGNAIHDFLPVHYHYLMFAYDQLDELEKAVQCAKSYLVFHPENKVMEKNLALYSNEINVTEYEARDEAILFHKRVKAESEILRYSYQYFGIVDRDESILNIFPVEAESEEEEDTQSSSEDAILNEDAATSKGEEEHQSSSEDAFPNEDVAISKGEEELSSLEESAKEELAENNESDEPYESMNKKMDDIIENKDEEEALKLEKARRDAEAKDNSVDDVDISPILSSNLGYKTVDSKYMITIDEKTKDTPLPEGPVLYPDVVFLANSTQLKGQTRFAVDSVATDAECRELIDLELSSGSAGDGYQGNSFPHTKHERFEGLSLLRAAELAETGSIPLESALLYYDLSEKTRAMVQAYFKLPELYFDYTHLVCRTAMPDSTKSRDDLSHPVHADNCYLKSDGCIKEHPAYTWRDYSAILYLNNDFDGGEFLFADSTARRVTSLIKPRCGRMVSFSAGPECYHGVKPILSGQRCAVALWFTMSKSREEKQRIAAKKILDALVLKKKEEL